MTTDAILLAGTDMPYGVFAGKRIYNQNGRCIDSEGTLGGTSLTMIDAIKNTVTCVGIPLDEALRMTTLYPAQALGIDNKLGIIAARYIANLMVFTPDFKVTKTIVNGQFRQ